MKHNWGRSKVIPAITGVDPIRPRILMEVPGRTYSGPYKPYTISFNTGWQNSVVPSGVTTATPK
jgi:hypothetical protein